jgi:hypothetical protein
MVWVTIDLCDGKKPLGFSLSEQDELRLRTFMAECYESKRYAERYRWLRNRDLETIAEGGVFIGVAPENMVINGEDADAYIDVHMGICSDER